jgi:hypothetical protein
MGRSVWAFEEIEQFLLVRRGACVAASEVTGIPACLEEKVGTESDCWRFGGSGFVVGREETPICLYLNYQRNLGISLFLATHGTRQSFPAPKLYVAERDSEDLRTKSNEIPSKLHKI